jgi:cephalosporin hydroxylase
MSSKDDQPNSGLNRSKTGDIARDYGTDELVRIAQFGGAHIERRLNTPLRDYWLTRAAMHTHDSYVGITLSKFPEDLRVYEHLLWAQRPDIVIEIGTQFGASALWFRDRLRMLAGYGLVADPHVITVDIETERAQRQLDRADPNWRMDISVVTGDVCDARLPQRIAGMIPASANCLVVEDSAHTYNTTLAAVEGFSRFVPEDGFMVVEDGYVDIDTMRLRRDWPRGVLPALADWLAGPVGSAFEVRRDLELYGITCHLGGLLQRRKG